MNKRTLHCLAALSLIVAGVMSWDNVRAAATRAGTLFSPVIAVGEEPRLQSGNTGPITVQKPSGQTAFVVTFKKAYKTPPDVVLTVVGNTEAPVMARLSGIATVNGFQGVVAAQYFTRNPSATVSVNWMALGE